MSNDRLKLMAGGRLAADWCPASITAAEPGLRLEGSGHHVFTRHQRSAILLALFMACPTYAASATDTTVRKPCRERQDLVGPCYSVRGRMNYSNGSPSVRIWVVGTKRMLGVTDSDCEGEGCSLPDQIASKLSWDTDLFGEFVVCPFTSDQPGVMRFVCVDSGTRLEARPRVRSTKK